MKITEAQLKQLIRESLNEVVDEYGGGYYPYNNNGQRVSSNYTNRGGWDDDYNDLDAVYRAQNARHMEMGLGNLEEGVDEATDEGLLGGFKGAAKGLRQAVGGEWNKFKRGVMDNGLNNEYQGQGVGDRFKTAGKQIGTAFRGGDKQQELDRAAKAVQSLIDGKTFGNNKVLSAPNTVQAAQTLLNAIKMAKMGSVGGVNSAAAKRYGAPQQPQAQRQVAESKLDKIIRESIKKNIG